MSQGINGQNWAGKDGVQSAERTDSYVIRVTLLRCHRSAL